MDPQTEDIVTFCLFAMNYVLFLLYSLLTIAMAGDLYYKYRIRTLEKMDTAEAHDEIVRISRICEGRLFGWYKKWKFFLNDTKDVYVTRGTADPDIGQCEDTNNDEKV